MTTQPQQTQEQGGAWRGAKERGIALKRTLAAVKPSMTDAVKAAAAEPVTPADVDAMRGVELLSEWIGSRTRLPHLSISEHIRRAARLGDPLAVRIVRDGILGAIDELADNGE